MPYVLHELPELGEKTTLGDPVHDLIVAKVIASRRAIRTQMITVIVDTETGQEVARFDPAGATPKASVRRIRLDAVPEEESGVSSVSNKTRSG